MFRNYFKIAFRNLGKNRLYAIINIFGLAAGLTACLLIGVYITHELSYDRFNANAPRIVRATMQYGKSGSINSAATTGTKVGPQLTRTFPVVEAYARTFIGHNVIKTADKVFDESRILYADPPFFHIFSFRLLEGSAATALDAPDKMVISESMAKKYFGDAYPINKTLICGTKVYTVSAVCEDAPQNSQLKFDFVTQFLNYGNMVKEEQWWTANWITYFLLRDEKSIPLFQQQVNAYMKTPAVKASAGLGENEFLAINLQPLTKVHLYSSLAGFEPNGSITYIYMFAGIALLILIIACANYTNLATAQSAGRSAEIGMRKVMGASKKQVFLQFIGESAVITFIAAAVALLSAFLLIPYFNYITGKQFTGLDLVKPLSIAALLACAVAVSFFAGLYPALVLSGTQVMGVLKKGFSFTGGNNFLRKTLIVAQFGISIFLISYTVIIVQQMHFMQTRNLGYDKDHIVVLPVTNTMLQNFQNIKDAFAQVPGVESVTASYDTPEYVQWQDGITATDNKGKHEVSVNAMPVDLDFIRTMKMQLADGRDFTLADFSLMDTFNNNANYERPYIINETLAGRIGWTPAEAIGRKITKDASGPVVGVVKDFNFSSLHNAIGPMLIFLDRDMSRNLMLRISGSNMSSAITALENTWKQRIPQKPFSYHFLDEAYNNLYQSEQRSALLFSVAAGIAIVLACLGLFGLAAFTTVQRTKEIGIRKILGAGTGNITLLISKHFMQLVAVAILLATPLAWWAAHHWLQDFAFRIQVNALVFVSTALATVSIVLCTVGYHAIKAALANPVKSLRTE